MNTTPYLLIDYSKGVRQLGGSETLYKKMLLRFCEDQTLSHLKTALSHSDRAEAYLQAHSLKGLCAQLALPAVMQEASQLCKLLQADDDQIPDGISTRMTALAVLHERTIQEILRLCHANS